MCLIPFYRACKNSTVMHRQERKMRRTNKRRKEGRQEKEGLKVEGNIRKGKKLSLSSYSVAHPMKDTCTSLCQ